MLSDIYSVRFEGFCIDDVVKNGSPRNRGIIKGLCFGRPCVVYRRSADIGKHRNARFFRCNGDPQGCRGCRLVGKHKFSHGDIQNAVGCGKIGVIFAVRCEKIRRKKETVYFGGGTYNENMG